MTHKQRMSKAIRGELADQLPYIPRIDLWYNANSRAGTLPPKHRGRTQDEISRAEGWGLHKVLTDLLDVRRPEDVAHRALGVYSLRNSVFRFRFSEKIGVRIRREGDDTFIEYETPAGKVSTKTIFPEELKKAGATLAFVKEHIIKKPEDYRAVGAIFENLELIPADEDFLEWQEEVGEDGLCAAVVSLASSPMHHIQKDFLDPTSFYFHYQDYQKEMQALAEKVSHFYEQALKIVSESPAELVFWGGNFDDMITYPPYFEKEILPWLKKVKEVLHSRGKLLLCHCDGENLGLLDLIRNSGIDVAEAICPYPMTKVKIEEYYRRWGDQLTIFGGIPSNLLLADLTPEEEFEAYLDHLFKAIAPGRRFILGIADTTPPDADFSRLIRIGERLNREAKLPLQAGAVRPITPVQMARAEALVAPAQAADGRFRKVREDVLQGNEGATEGHVLELIRQGVAPQEIIDHGLVAAMEEIGPKFKVGELFIPEVLLSARALNRGLSALEPYLSKGDRVSKGRVVIGTVKGDLHDIGKNMVATMLRGVGFEVIDLGIDVRVETFRESVRNHRPRLLGLSALLTTTMPEMKRVVEELSQAGLREGVKVIVGGAPVNAKYAQTIGADGYAADACEAVELARRLLGDHCGPVGPRNEGDAPYRSEL